MEARNNPTHTILIHDSHWASNIGNAFFNQGAKYLLEKACPSSTVLSTASSVQTGWTITDNTLLKNDLNYIKYSNPDWFVLSGPMFDRNFPLIYDEIFQKILENGRTKLILLSTGGITYDDDEVRVNRQFLKKHKPFILTTRDQQTFSNYSDLAENAHDGICNAFFVPDYYPGYPTPSLSPYITMTFDSMKEPKIDLSMYDESTIRDFEAPVVPFKKMEKAEKLVPEQLATKIGNFSVVRPCHRTLNTPLRRLLAKPNSFFSMTHSGYLNIYRNSILTLTDRVHACVAALAYGNPARLYTNSKRSMLLERVGAGNVLNEITRLDMRKILNEKKGLIDFISKSHKMEQ